ncbi:MAG: methionyl-tRNA formyltransferase [Dehalococcoidales bacterium]
MRIIFMGSPRFSVTALEKLLDSQYNIVAVCTQPDRPSGRGRSMAVSPVKEAALRWKLPLLQPETLREKSALEQVKAYKPDVIVVCAFGQILPQALLDIPPQQCLNVHYSLLSRHRGASPVAAAILAGDEFTGVSIQLVRFKVDTGPILAKASIPISNEDTTGTLLEKLSVVGADLLVEALKGWINGTLKPITQDESQSTYFGQVKKEDGEIDWHMPAVDIWRRVRAYNPWPGCFTYWRDKQLKINEAYYLQENGVKEAGSVIALDRAESGIGVTTGSGILLVKNIQYAGKKAMTAAEFLRGQRDFIGTKLGDWRNCGNAHKSKCAIAQQRKYGKYEQK